MWFKLDVTVVVLVNIPFHQETCLYGITDENGEVSIVDSRDIPYELYQAVFSGTEFEEVDYCAFFNQSK